jgi:hypothetical protein
MYSSYRSQDGAQSGSRGSDNTQSRDAFRPVALPALAAAVHVQNAAAETARAKLAARRSVQVVHEDEPSL